MPKDAGQFAGFAHLSGLAAVRADPGIVFGWLPIS